MGNIEWKLHPVLTDYEISSDGQVRRATKARTRHAGHMPRGHVRGGYWAYKLALPKGGKGTFWAHRLVLEAFVGAQPTPSHVVAHYDGNPLNNSVENLRWATAQENADDLARHGSLKGEGNGRSRLTAEQVLEVRSRYSGKYGEQSRLAREYGLSASAMRSVLIGEHWQNVA